MGDDARRTMWGSAESENDGSEIGGGVAKKESVKVGKGKKVTAHITGSTHTEDAISDGDYESGRKMSEYHFYPFHEERMHHVRSFHETLPRK